MAISYFIIWVFALLINKVSAETENLVGVIGRSTILPCFSNDNGNKLTKINVRWRHNGSLNVCDITKDKCSEEHQEPGYKNRAEVFPKEFDKGNFSLKLSNLMPTDAGEYKCYIIHPPAPLVKVQLHLNGSEADKGDPTTETTLMLKIIPVFIVLLLLVCVIIIMKRCYKTSGSGMSANGGHLSNNDSHQPLSNTSEPANQNHQDFSALQNNI